MIGYVEFHIHSCPEYVHSYKIVKLSESTYITTPRSGCTSHFVILSTFWFLSHFVTPTWVCSPASVDRSMKGLFDPSHRSMKGEYLRPLISIISIDHYNTFANECKIYRNLITTPQAQISFNEKADQVCKNQWAQISFNEKAVQLCNTQQFFREGCCMSKSSHTLNQALFTAH